MQGHLRGRYAESADSLSMATRSLVREDSRPPLSTVCSELSDLLILALFPRSPKLRFVYWLHAWPALVAQHAAIMARPPGCGPSPEGQGVDQSICLAAMARASSSCSGVSTENWSPSTSRVSMRMPASISRSCSSFSKCSRGEMGSWGQRSNTSAR